MSSRQQHCVVSQDQDRAPAVRPTTHISSFLDSFSVLVWTRVWATICDAGIRILRRMLTQIWVSQRLAVLHGNIRLLDAIGTHRRQG